MMKKTIFFLCISFFSQLLMAQSHLDCYRIFFTDKNESNYTIDQPLQFLSQRAIDKRARFQIPITEEDFPISSIYIEEVLNLDESMKLLTRSKWNNTIVVYCANSLWIDSASLFSFIAYIQPIATYDELLPRKAATEISNHFHFDNALFDYGLSYSQISIHQGEKLHELDFMGEGMLIAVLDAGWSQFTTLSNLASLFTNGQIVGTRDLQPESGNVYEGHSHGTAVTSIMAAEIDGELIGSAPKASYFFIRSENPWSEQWIEEDFWAEAAEIADSIGADVINSSLGYTTFSNFPDGFSYAQSDGESSVASRAATIAAQKGIIVSISAGNSGDSPWHYVGRPADAKDILAVGAINRDSIPAPFTSVGPSYDGRIKPDVAAVGWFTAHLAQNDSVYLGHGTSYASPVIAGLSACLWQALPQYSALEIMQIIRHSSHQFTCPDTLMGYGIPNFYRAYLENQSTHISNNIKNVTCIVYPNPATDKVYITCSPSQQLLQLQLFDMLGKPQSIEKNVINASSIELGIAQLSEGIYFLKVMVNKEDNCKYTFGKKIIKQ